jgi:serine/threonine-protein kinase
LPRFGEKYEIERVIGRGGMGTVFEACHTRLGQRVALKALAPELRGCPELVARFEREARAASALSSPHAVRVFDIDVGEDGTPFMVMELLSGCDLGRRLDDDGPQPIGRAVRWIIQACEALGEAHRLGIVHRDIKPSNLLLCASGGIKVLDFGIAKQRPPRPGVREAAITNATTPLGTPQYMSPEQVRSAKDVDARTDIWALGVTLYELLCGRPPYDHDQPAACIAAIVADPIPDPRQFRPDLPADLALAILKALEKDPAARFITTEHFVAALLPYAEPDSSNAITDPCASGTRARYGPGDSPTLDDAVVDVPASHAPVPRSRARRVRSVVGFASALVCGLGVLVLTPQFIDARPSKVVPTLDPVPSAAPLPTATAAVDADAGAGVLERAARADATTHREPDPPAPSAKMVRPPRPVSTSRSSSDRLVHGGLSGPGF